MFILLLIWFVAFFLSLSLILSLSFFFLSLALFTFNDFFTSPSLTSSHLNFKSFLSFISTPFIPFSLSLSLSLSLSFSLIPIYILLLLYPASLPSSFTHLHSSHLSYFPSPLSFYFYPSILIPFSFPSVSPSDELPLNPLLRDPR